MLTKICKKCGIEKSADEFYKRKDNGNYRLKCKVCLGVQQKEWNLRNKNVVRENQKEWYLRNIDVEKKKQKEYRIKNEDTIRNRHKEYHSTHIRIYDKELKNISTIKWKNSLALYKTYTYKLKYADEVKNNNGLLEVRCTYCNKWFTPTNSQIRNRIGALIGSGRGEQRLYCSDGCKKSCPTFGQKKYEKGIRLATSREVPAEFRKIALEDRNYTCEKCNSIEDALHVHHIEGYTEQPMFRSDLSNVIVVCKKCHKEIHKQKGCNYQDYQCANKKENST
jgi:hypothetical protein